MEAVRIATLLYHRIGKPRTRAEERYCVRPELFRAQMEALANAGMRACSVDHFVDWLEGRRELPERSFVITFDDGYLDTYEFAVPVLSAFQWPCAVFLVSGLLGQTDSWVTGPDSAKVAHRLLGLREIREMSQLGVAFQCHSRHHPDLTTLSDRELAEEVGGARVDLEGILGTPVRYFAYPFGRFDQRVETVVRAAGYRAAFSVESGFNRPGSNRLRIRRIDVFGSDSPRQLWRKVTFGTNNGSWLESIRYYATKLVAYKAGSSR